MYTEITDDWDSLDNEHKKFALRVRNSRGCKHGASPCSSFSENIDEPSIGFWTECERLGFIECTGSYKWEITDKFSTLERELFKITN